MRETVDVTGMVLRAGPVGEYDRRLVILTRERGKITAFARGAKRPGSQLMAVCRPFVFGRFCLFEGREAYSLHSAEIKNYFQELSADVESACYGSYFLEFADYYSRENLDGSELILLLYQSFRALLKPAIPNTLIRSIFELRAMGASGECGEHPPEAVSDSARYAWEYILSAPFEKLYTFVLRPETERELRRCVDRQRRLLIDREFHSLEVLRMMTGEN